MQTDFYFVSHLSHASPRYAGQGPVAGWGWGIFRKLAHGGIVFVGTADAAPDDVPAELGAIAKQLDADRERLTSERSFAVVPVDATANQTCPVGGVTVPVYRGGTFGISGFGPCVKLLSVAQAQSVCPRLVDLMRSRGHLPPAEPAPEPEAVRHRRDRAAAAREGARLRKQRIEQQMAQWEQARAEDRQATVEDLAGLLASMRDSDADLRAVADQIIDTLEGFFVDLYALRGPDGK